MTINCLFPFGRGSKSRVILLESCNFFLHSWPLTDFDRPLTKRIDGDKSMKKWWKMSIRRKIIKNKMWSSTLFAFSKSNHLIKIRVNIIIKKSMLRKNNKILTTLYIKNKNDRSWHDCEIWRSFGGCRLYT